MRMQFKKKAFGLLSVDLWGYRLSNLWEEARSLEERTATSGQDLRPSEKKQTSLEERSRSLEEADVLKPKTSKEHAK